MALASLLRRLLLGLLAAALALGATVVGVLAYPEPLYDYHAEFGRLRLYADRPFDAEHARTVLADVERRLAAAPPALRDPDSTFRIFVSNSDWRRRLTFLWNYRAGGVNYYPIGGSVFLRQADIDADRLLRSDGAPVPEPRSLAYYAAHEIGHSLIGARVGALANWRLPAWVKEGAADWIGFGGAVDLPALMQAWRAGDADLDPQRSGTYALYRLMVGYFLERERWSIDELLATTMPRREAESQVRVGMAAD